MPRGPELIIGNIYSGLVTAARARGVMRRLQRLGVCRGRMMTRENEPGIYMLV